MYLQIRFALYNHCVKNFGAEKLGGPPGEYAVILDQTFFTKKKRARGGFGGRTTRGHETVVFGGVELHLPTRRETGRAFLVVIPDMSKRTFQKVITERVHPGSMIWTDSHKSYEWLGRPDSGYFWESINHRRREFARVERGVNVSTNAIEGLFSRMKASFRHLGVKKVAHRRYGLFLAEYIYRSRYFHHNAEWRDGGLWMLCQTLAEEFPPPRLEAQMATPPEYVEMWDAWKESTRSAILPRVEIPIPQRRAPAPAPAANPAPDPAPRPAPAAPRRSVWQRLTNPIAPPRCNLVFESDSDIEVVGVRGPAPAAEQVPPAPVEVAIPVAPLDPPREPVLPITAAIRCVPFGHAMQRCRITPEMHAEFRTWCDRCQIGVLPGRFCHHCAVCDYSLCVACATRRHED